MKNIVRITLIYCAFFTAEILNAVDKPPENRDAFITAHGILKNLIADNNAFSNSKSAKEFLALNKNQTSRATMVLCSDSRVHTHSFDSTPENDLFVIRNHELQTIELIKDILVTEGVVTNIHQQVKNASQKFANLIKQNKLVVVGAVYDFSNELGHGPDKLILLNLNGEKNASKIKDCAVLKGIESVNIGWKK